MRHLSEDAVALTVAATEAEQRQVRARRCRVGHKLVVFKVYKRLSTKGGRLRKRSVQAQAKQA